LKRVKLLIKSVTVIFAGGEPPLLSEKGGGRERVKVSKKSGEIGSQWRCLLMKEDWSSAEVTLRDAWKTMDFDKPTASERGSGEERREGKQCSAEKDQDGSSQIDYKQWDDDRSSSATQSRLMDRRRRNSSSTLALSSLTPK
jgi:hypothetical protein